MINGAHAIVYSTDPDADRIACSDIQAMSWGRLIRVKLAGGGTLGVYQPQHPRAAPVE